MRSSCGSGWARSLHGKFVIEPTSFELQIEEGVVDDPVFETLAQCENSLGDPVERVRRPPSQLAGPGAPGQLAQNGGTDLAVPMNHSSRDQQEGLFNSLEGPMLGCSLFHL